MPRKILKFNKNGNVEEKLQQMEAMLINSPNGSEVTFVVRSPKGESIYAKDHKSNDDIYPSEKSFVEGGDNDHNFAFD